MTSRLKSASALALLAAAWLLALNALPRAQDRRGGVAAAGGAGVRQASSRIDRQLRSGDLQLARTSTDPMLPGRTHERLHQYFKGVRVFGAAVTRELDNGAPAAVLGETYEGIDVDVQPALTALDAKAIVERLSGEAIGASRMPQLVVLPRDDGSYVLAYDAQVVTPDDIIRYFIDARTGDVAFQYSNLQTQTASVGRGTGVLGDQKKVMTALLNGSYYTLDKMRPLTIYTYDMKSNIQRMVDVLNGRTQLTWNDVAMDADNVWTDGAAVDAQVYAGFTYDYYYKRMGRKGLNDRNLTMRMFVHPIDRNAWKSLYSTYSVYYTNAFYAGGGWMVFGEGLPPDVSTSGGKKWNYTSAALDIVAHELTHGVTDYSSDLIYVNESGALSEAFSDIMATAIEFYFQPAATDTLNGSGPMTADYVEGEDAVTPGGVRSMSNPGANGNPDNYRNRYTGSADGGGVHTNSTIVSHAFFLAVEGGTNRTSGLSVRGVGGANREQIEKIFYNAFAFRLPSNATFSTARAATIQAADELYGSGSAAEQAVIQAWDAVGVDVGTAPSPAASAARAILRRR